MSRTGLTNQQEKHCGTSCSQGRQPSPNIWNQEPLQTCTVIIKPQDIFLALWLYRNLPHMNKQVYSVIYWQLSSYQWINVWDYNENSLKAKGTTFYLFPIAAFRYSTFLSIYKEKWSDILKFRQKSMSLSEHDMSLFLFCFTVCLGRIGPLFKLHGGLLLALRFTQCELCYCFKESIKNAGSLEEKLASVLAYREHLSALWRDRCICWSLQELALDHMSDVLVIQVDGLDQSKFRLPRDPALRATASSALVQAQRPKIKVHGVWCFGPLDSYNSFFHGDVV